MPEFLWGFADLADRLGADVVGEPVEDEHLTSPMSPLSHLVGHVISGGSEE